MATTVYNDFKQRCMAAYFTGADIRIALLMTNTTAGSENDGIVNIADITTLDEFDGANYARQALASEASNKDDANDRAEFDANDVTLTALGAGTRSIAGVMVYEHVDGTDANDLVIGFVQYTTPKVADGSDFTIQWNAEGILQNS